MVTELLSEKYADKMWGVLNCYDRVVLSGNLQPLCYAKGMTGYLYGQKIRIFDYAEFATPLREEIRINAEALAKENGVEIEFIRKAKSFRKEDRIEKIMQGRGEQPGLVHIFSAMEGCTAYEPWHDKPSGKNYVRQTTGKCLHYYFYFVDEDLGLCYLRVPTWCPFRLQFYYNGHNALANQLRQGVAFEQLDNAFIQIGDIELANRLAAQLDCEKLCAKLNALAERYCPAVRTLQLSYTWSIYQAEFATDLIFKDQQTLQAFYPLLLDTLIQAVHPADIATFFGRKLNGNYQGEMGTRFNRRWLGRRVKHHMGPVSLKLYDKFNLILRIETTVNDVTFFKQFRQVNHRNGSTSSSWTTMTKTIFSLPALQECLLAANQRYLKFISAIETPHVGVEKLHQLAETKVENDHRFKGFNLFSEEDSCFFSALLSGEFCISGFTNRNLRTIFPHKNSGQMTRLLNRLHAHGLIKKVSKRYKYYLTDFGRQVVTMALKLRSMVVIPQLAATYPTHP
jgi:hypothetical protein